MFFALVCCYSLLPRQVALRHVTVDEVRRLRIVKQAGVVRADLATKLQNVVSVVAAWCLRVQVLVRVCSCRPCAGGGLVNRGMFGTPPTGCSSHRFQRRRCRRPRCGLMVIGT